MRYFDAARRKYRWQVSIRGLGEVKACPVLPGPFVSFFFEPISSGLHAVMIWASIMLKICRKNNSGGQMKRQTYYIQSRTVFYYTILRAFLLYSWAWEEEKKVSHLILTKEPFLKQGIDGPRDGVSWYSSIVLLRCRSKDKWTFWRD